MLFNDLCAARRMEDDKKNKKPKEVSYRIYISLALRKDCALTRLKWTHT